MKRNAFCLWLLTLTAWTTLGTPAAAQTRIACLGEASTHSAHRENDPEYPELMGRFLDDDFTVDGSPANPLSGGMLHGGGTNYRIGNFGIPRGTVIDSAAGDTQSTFTSDQLLMAEEFAPDVVILGPYGAHERYSNMDVAANFVVDLRKLSQRILDFPSAPTLFIATPIPRWGEDTNAERRSIREWTEQVAEEMGLPIIDLWNPFLGTRDEFFNDQNHLSLAGREYHGTLVGEAIAAWKAAGGGDLTTTGGQGGTGVNATSGTTGGNPATTGGQQGTGGNATSGGAATTTGGQGGTGGNATSGGTAAAGGTSEPTSSTTSISSSASASTGGPSPPVATSTGPGAPEASTLAGGTSSGVAAPSRDQAAGCAMRPTRGDPAGGFGVLLGIVLFMFSGFRRRFTP